MPSVAIYRTFIAAFYRIRNNNKDLALKLCQYGGKRSFVGYNNVHHLNEILLQDKSFTKCPWFTPWNGRKNNFVGCHNIYYLNELLQ